MTRRPSLGVVAVLLLALVAGPGSLRAQGTVDQVPVQCVYAAHAPDQVCEQALVAAVADKINALLNDGNGYTVDLGEPDLRTGQKPLRLLTSAGDTVPIQVDSLPDWTPKDAKCDDRYRALLGAPFPVFQSEEGKPVKPVIWAAPGSWQPSSGVVPLCLYWPACPRVVEVEKVEECKEAADSHSEPKEPQTAQAEGPFPTVIAIIAIIAFVVAIPTAVLLFHLFRKHGRDKSRMVEGLEGLGKMVDGVRGQVAKAGPSTVELGEDVFALSARVDQIEANVRGLSEGQRRDRAALGVSRSPSRGADTSGAAMSPASPPAMDRPYRSVDTHFDPRRLPDEMVAVFQRHMARRGGAPEPDVPFERVDAWLLEDGRVLDHSETGARIWIVETDQRGDSALAMPDPTWIRVKLPMLRSSPVNAIGTLLGGAFDTTRRTDGAEALELLRPARLQRHAGWTWQVVERGELAYRPT